MPNLALVLLLAVVGVAQHAAAQDVAAKLADYMDAQARVNHFSGAVLVAKNGKPLFEHAYGFADIDRRVPNTVETEFRIASITKIFTAAAVLMLRDEGKLKLDDSVFDYISGCPDTWRAITLKQLLTHSSGIPDDFAELTRMRREHRSPAEFIAAIKQHAPAFPPRTHARYSNSGYILLGGVIAQVSGEPYADFLRQRIFGPLGMQHTIAEISHGADEAFGYSWDGKDYRKADLLDVSGLSSATMVASTVSDLLRFVESLEQGKLLKLSTVVEMWTPQVDGHGYSWHIGTVNGRKAVSHGGDVEGFSSALWYFPEQHLFVASLSNVGGVEPAKMIGDLTAVWFGEPYTIPHERQFVQLSVEQMKPLVGTYRLNSGGTICVTVEADQLMLAPGNGSAAECRPESGDKCFLPPMSNEVTFVRDASGKVIGLRMGDHTELDAMKKSDTEYKQCPALFAH
jgi:CubicO group peptidase (beta-lactamase class C family)